MIASPQLSKQGSVIYNQNEILSFDLEAFKKMIPIERIMRMEHRGNLMSGVGMTSTSYGVGEEVIL